MKTRLFFALGVVCWGGLQVVGATPAASGPAGRLELNIQHPSAGTVLTGSEISIEVQGGASVFGGVKQLDLVLVLDTSRSLRNTDPNDYRMWGAIGLVESLPAWSDVQIGVVAFARRAEILSPLTADRDAVVRSLRNLGHGSATNLAAGIDTALEDFEQGAREGSTRVMLLFTDGKSNEKKARAAMKRALEQGVVIHSLLLGRDKTGEKILRGIATGTSGSFLLVTDPTKLPAAFLDLRTTGVESVSLRVNDSAPIPTLLTMGSFSGEVPLTRGENQIVATVTSLDGTTRSESVTITVRPEGCSELAIQAVRDGQPALSISDRSVEIVMDASQSMWGQLGGEAKMAIAKQMLDDALGWLPNDLTLSLRVYGHQHTPAEHDCEDTQLLVPASPDNRAEIRSAIAGLRPKGQTPLGYALEQLARDFEGVRGERAVVLVTDGIESCGGDAPGAARALQAEGPVPIHVIGFGMSDATAEDLASLRAIADASGGRFLTAGSARELEQALMTTVGTPFTVATGGATVGAGTLGTDEVMRLPAGDYVVRLDSNPPQQAQVTLESEVRHTVVFSSTAHDGGSHTARRDSAEYSVCDEPAGVLETSSPPDPMPALTLDPTVPAPAKAAPRAAPPREREPKARREALFELEGGSVEVWQNLRPNRTSDWAVVVRHPSVGPNVMIYTGDDRAVAQTTAESARDTLRSGGSLDLPGTR